ncbi:MPT63 family protein [Mycolicibacterium thermoresistibile]
MRKYLTAVFAAPVAAAFTMVTAPGAVAQPPPPPPAVDVPPPPAHAHPPPVPQAFGTPQQLHAPTGEIAEWTVHDLRRSHDVIPAGVAGDLWEATATLRAVHGGATPVVSDFNARAANGDTYRVMFGAPTPEGFNPSSIAQGETSTGKLYFDVLGPAPDSVVYNDGVGDVLLWVQ